MSADERRALARQVAAAYAEIPEVEAVALGGSVATEFAGPEADIDLYVYSSAPVSLDDRRSIATTSASRAAVDNQFWEPGDEWIDADSDTHVDVMFRHAAWIEDQIDRVLVRHEAQLGYTTAFWHNVRTSEPLFDRAGWFAALQERANAPYPEELRRAIIAKNYPVLRSTLSSYRHQLHRAIARQDLVSVNHRITAFLASYFDILFALNRQTHPGEKRILQHIARSCEIAPQHLDELIETMFWYGGRGGAEAVHALDELCDRLDELPAMNGIIS